MLFLGRREITVYFYYSMNKKLSSFTLKAHNHEYCSLPFSTRIRISANVMRNLLHKAFVVNTNIYMLFACMFVFVWIYMCICVFFFIFVEKEYINASIYAADCSSAACVWDLWISATLLLLCSAFIQFFFAYVLFAQTVEHCCFSSVALDYCIHTQLCCFRHCFYTTFCCSDM